MLWYVRTYGTYGTLFKKRVELKVWEIFCRGIIAQIFAKWKLILKVHFHPGLVWNCLVSSWSACVLAYIWISYFDKNIQLPGTPYVPLVFFLIILSPQLLQLWWIGCGSLSSIGVLFAWQWISANSANLSSFSLEWLYTLIYNWFDNR